LICSTRIGLSESDTRERTSKIKNQLSTYST